MGPPPRPGTAWVRRAVIVTVLVAVVSPALRDHDSFPLSTYPMYAGTSGKVVSIATALGVDRSGAVHYLPLRTVADTDDPLIAESTVRQAITTHHADALCVEIAGRARDPLVRIEVVDERHDVLARAAGDESLLGRSVHARCPVTP